VDIYSRVVQILQIEPTDLEALPEELKEQFPEIVDDLREGVINEVPERVLEQLPPTVIDRIPESLLASNVNMTFVIILGIIGVIAAAGFFYGMAKAAMKAAMFFLVVSAVAWFLLYAQY